jgi:hypothetical protein
MITNNMMLLSKNSRQTLFYRIASRTVLKYPAVNFINIFWAAFLQIFLHQNIAKLKCNLMKAPKKHFHGKRSRVKCWWNWHLFTIKFLTTFFTSNDIFFEQRNKFIWNKCFFIFFNFSVSRRKRRKCCQHLIVLQSSDIFPTKWKSDCIHHSLTRIRRQISFLLKNNNQFNFIAIIKQNTFNIFFHLKLNYWIIFYFKSFKRNDIFKPHLNKCFLQKLFHEIIFCPYREVWISKNRNAKQISQRRERKDKPVSRTLPVWKLG